MTDCKHSWKKVDGFYALTVVEKKGEQINFKPGSGMPIEVEICTRCNKIRIFSAIGRGSFK